MILLFLYALGGSVLVVIFKKMKLSLSLYLVLPQILLLLVPTIIYFVITKQSVTETLRFKKIGAKTVFIVISIGLIAMPIATFLSLITQFIFPNRISQVVSALSNIPFIIRVAIVALTPAICEEITMRGIVLAGYDNIDIKKAAVMTGLFFGIIHMDGNQFLYAFVLGIVFAYLVRITGSIFSSMICHFTINGTQLLLAELSTYFLKFSNEELKTAQDAGLSAFTTSQQINLVLFYLTLAIICIGIIVMLMQKLITIHGRDGIRVTEGQKDNTKVINWPVYVTVGLYIYIIANQLITIYK
nr:type II CAAX endopeptidase family protein [Clostridium ganghwense]